MFFVKNPVPGEVKTRLARRIGNEKAARLYRLMAEDGLAAIDASRIPSEIHYSPKEDGKVIAAWLGAGRRYVPQSGGGLGARMEHAFRHAFRFGAARALLAGSDIPGLRPDHLNSALGALSEHDAVLAPAGDGGYTLIGFTDAGFKPEAFSGIEWGGPDVLDDTLQALNGTGASWSLLPELPDLDDFDDLSSFYKRGVSRPCKTLEWLHKNRDEIFRRT
jgi:hypothetical protein